MTKSITGLSPKEAELLSSLAKDGKSIFTVEDARRVSDDYAYIPILLDKLEEKGWLHRLERGTYMLIPLEAGPDREWSESALVIASHLIQPSAIAYWSALHYWTMTEQVPRTVFVQSTARKHQLEKEVLGILYRFVTVVEAKFFGVTQGSVGGQPIQITDREKTIVDAADRLDLSGGAAQLAQALRTARETLEWDRLDTYLERWPARSPSKRLGYLIETLDLPIPDREKRLARWHQSLTTGIVPLEPGEDEKQGRIVTRWQLRVNIDETWRSGERRNDP